MNKLNLNKLLTVFGSTSSDTLDAPLGWWHSDEMVLFSLLKIADWLKKEELKEEKKNVFTYDA